MAQMVSNRNAVSDSKSIGIDSIETTQSNVQQKGNIREKEPARRETTRGNDIHNIAITTQSCDLLSIRVPAPTTNRIQGGLTQLQSKNHYPQDLIAF